MRWQQKNVEEVRVRIWLGARVCIVCVCVCRSGILVRGIGARLFYEEI